MVSPHALRVLVADDDERCLREAVDLVVACGHQVVATAKTGREVVTLVPATEPDFVLMDIQMPEMDGIQATLAILQSNHLPIVLITAYDDPAMVSLAAEAGAAAYLTKPLNRLEVERAVTLAWARFDDLLRLRSLNRELASLNDELNAFAATVAHDLRHFLGPIVGYVEVLYEDYERIDAQEAKRYLGWIARAGRDMNALIEELLLLDHVRRGRVTLRAFDMALVVQEAQRRLAHLAQAGKAEVFGPATWPMVQGYAPWVVEVWVNYLSNALKYGGETPTIEIGWQELSDMDVLDVVWAQPSGSVSSPALPSLPMVCFWVRDRGDGIPAERLPSLFDAYSDPRQSRLHGHGLGLSIVRRIVERLGGRVGVASKVGGGSTFVFTLAPAADNLTTSTKESG